MSRLRSLRPPTLPGVAGVSPIWSALVVVLAVGWAVVALDGGNLFETRTLTDILQRSVALGIVAVGQTVAIVGGSLDLSVAQVISLSSLVAAEVMDGRSSMLVPGIAATVALGVGVGLANGLIVTKLRVNPFIATLGVALLLRAYVEANWAGPAGAVPDGFESFGYTRMGPIPVSVFLFAGVAIVVGLALRRTAWGYHVYAVGGDERVSALSGLRTHRVTIGAHVVCSVTAALTGLFLASRLGSGSPHVGTDGGYDLESIAAVVLGGTALAGGKGKVAGTVGAVFVLAVLDNVFNQLGVDPFLKQVVRGVVIVAAVAVYARRKRTPVARPPAAGPIVTEDAPAAEPSGPDAAGGPDSPTLQGAHP